MKVKNVDLKYMAFRYDWNSHKLVFTNVLPSVEEIAKKIKRNINVKKKIMMTICSCYKIINLT